MSLTALGLIVFSVSYGVNLFYITVLYHRGLAHSSVVLHPRMKKFLAATGNWVTGIDPKAWACMHRLHHEHSDTKLDPHSPWNDGVFGLMGAQHKAYQRTIVGLARGKSFYADAVQDLDFPVHWLNLSGLWWVPYALHTAIAAAIAFGVQSFWVGFAYLLGIITHPIQGWMVNSFAHKFGYRNFETEDQSKNNTIVAWLVAGEGYQNNHHAFPGSAKFSKRYFEVDTGYALCLLGQGLGLLTVPKMPKQKPQESDSIPPLPTSPSF